MLEQFQSDMIEAMKNKDKFTLSVLRMVKGSLDKERIDKKIELNDEVLTDVLAKEVKTRRESIEEFKKGNRNDLVEDTLKEIEILKKYLPEELSLDKVTEIIDDALKETGASTMKDMGKVMGIVTPKVKGRFDMREVSSIIKSKLS